MAPHEPGIPGYGYGTRHDARYGSWYDGMAPVWIGMMGMIPDGHGSWYDGYGTGMTPYMV